MKISYLHQVIYKSKKGILPFLLLLLLLMVSGALVVQAQQMSYSETDGRINTVNTAVPFLRIAPDARSGAMGNTGIALSPDANSVYWNLSGLSFAQDTAEVSVSYTPWLRQMANDVFISYISAYKQLDDMQTIGASLRYFDMGNIELTDFQGQSQGSTHPREFSFDAGYARKLSDHWSLGIAFRYIHSNLVTGIKMESGSTYKAGNAFAGDISTTYIKNVQYADHETGTWRIGATVTNIGTMISYTSSKRDRYFIPTNAGMGASYTRHLANDKHEITLSADVNKLLVPSPDTTDNNHDGIPDYREENVAGSLFKSLYDAPGGLKEEFHELMYSVGAEYWYDHLFALRAGYYNEYKTKGDRKFVSLGFGLKYKMIGIDFSYIVPSGGSMQRSPLSNTVRISLLATLGGSNNESHKNISSKQ